MIKTIQRRLDAILHWNISFVGGFLGGYAILSHAGVFGSAQTGNLMEMASNVRFMEWEELGLRLLAMVIFACGVIASYMLTNYTNLHMRKLAIWVDAAGLGLTALLPDWFSPIAGVYPIFFCSAFQWGVYSGADGFNSATVFITNNFKQSVLGWTQYALTKDKEFKRKAVLYSNTVLMFFLGALLGVLHPECLVQTQFSDSEFPVKCRDRLFKFFYIRRCLQMTAELCDPVSDPLVEQFSRVRGLLIVQQIPVP